MGNGISVQYRRIILIGKEEDDKSSTRTTIEQQVFRAKELAQYDNNSFLLLRKIKVIDTPEFFDTDHDEKIKSESLVERAKGFDAIVVVLKVGIYRRLENKVVLQILNTLKEVDALKHTVVLFTFGEQLEDRKIEEFVNGNSKLQELVDKCGGRCLVIDNKYWNDCHSGDKSNRVQIKHLLETIDEMVKENGCYTNKLLLEQIKEEKRKNKNKLHPGKKLPKAFDFMHNKTTERVVGTAAGLLTGGVLGLGVAVAAVLGVLKFVDISRKLQKAICPGGATGAQATAVARGGGTEGGAPAREGRGAATGGAEGVASVAEVVSEATTAEETGAITEAAVAEVGVGGEVAEAGVITVKVGVAGGVAEAGVIAAEVGVAGGDAEAGVIAAEVGVAAAEAGVIAAEVGVAGGVAEAGVIAAEVGVAAAEAGVIAAEVGVAGGVAEAGVIAAEVGAAAAEAGLIAAEVGVAAAEAGVIAAEVGVAGGVAEAGVIAAEVGVAGGVAEAGVIAAEVGVAGGVAEAGVIAAEVGVAAAEAGGPITVAVVANTAFAAGAIGGAIIGYQEAEDADSVGDAIYKAAKANFENAKSVVKAIKEFTN